MKAFNYILISFLILSSCSQEKKSLNEFYSHDFKKYRVDSEFEIIDLDSMTNYSDLRKKMEKLDCEKKISGLRFELNDTIYHITGFAKCPRSPIGCYFRINLLFVVNDSLVIEFRKKKKPIKYLKKELNEIMSKEYNFQYNKNKLNRAIIHFYVEDKYPVLTTKRALKEIAEQFGEINSKNGPDYFEYHILFEPYDFTKIVIPPPPPPDPNEVDN